MKKKTNKEIDPVSLFEKNIISKRKANKAKNNSNNLQYQYSERLALPEKIVYLLKQVFIACKKVILIIKFNSMADYITSNLKTELGYFTLKSINKRITCFYPSKDKCEKINNNYLHKNFLKTLNDYFLKKSFSFNYQLKLFGTAFEKKVWYEIYKIRYGKTITYNDIAKKLNSSPRAIGNACSKNKCLFIIPCHRVIHTNGSTGGYVLGENIKEYLIKLEKDAK